jgi:hypothetical protein
VTRVSVHHGAPPTGHQVVTELTRAGLTRPCPSTCAPSTAPHRDGVCPQCARPWTETPVELSQGAA